MSSSFRSESQWHVDAGPEVHVPILFKELRLLINVNYIYASEADWPQDEVWTGDAGGPEDAGARDTKDCGSGMVGGTGIEPVTPAV